jgi:topoisomerase-4 subunit A
VTKVAENRVQEIEFTTALEDRYLAYALSTITGRSLPDVRDGLKPVQRRLLFAMRQLRLDPKSGFKKCARVVGDVIGKFHPHGDQAVYDALVRMAQEFAARYPLVEGQGNFGNVDGDNAAAMRYTEARLTAVAEAMLEGIDEDSVDFRETYDGSEREPAVLPAGFPNLLANGATGIAVGMATSIPPHNIGELCDALLHLIKHPNATIDKLTELIPGPDMPTGGVVVEPRDKIVEAYATGRGSFRLRAKWSVEQLARGQYQIVVTEIPYQVPKSRLVERIAELILDKSVGLVTDVRDESTEDVRLVIEPRSRTVDASVVMETLFRRTDLETRVNLNMNVLEGGRTPRVMNLREVLRAYLDHRHEVLARRTRHRLEHIEHRLDVLGGYLVAFANLDEVIRIVREEDAPKAVLVARLGVNEVQADAILNLRLRALRRLERMGIETEHEALRLKRLELEALIAEDAKRWRAIADEVKDIRKRFSIEDGNGRRRTEIGQAPQLAPIAAEFLVEAEPITVVCSAKGWIRALRGTDAVAAEARYKDGDRHRFWLPAQTTDRLLIFGTNGRFYTLSAEGLPRGRGDGNPVRLMIDLGEEEDIVAMLVHRPGRTLVVAASDGRGFLVAEDDVVAHTRAGKQVLNVRPPVEAQVCRPGEGDSLAVVGENRKLLMFAVDAVPTMSRGRGVVLQRYVDGGLSDAIVFNLAEGVSWSAGERQRTERDVSHWQGKRGQAGRVAPRGFPRSNRFSQG